MIDTSKPSDFYSRFLQPLTQALSFSRNTRSCATISDIAHLHVGVLRALFHVCSGREWIQHLHMNGDTHIRVGGFFDALRSKRRLNMIREAAAGVQKIAKDRLADTDPFAPHPELNGFAIYSTDGHSHGASAHEEPIQGKKWAINWIYSLDLRTHIVMPLALCTPQLGKKKEHEISTLKRIPGGDLRMGQPVGTKVLHAYDPAIIDYELWYNLKKGRGVYILTVEKANSVLAVQGEIPFDASDTRNTGVLSDEFVGPAHGGLLRRITYIDPVSGKTYRFLTNEFNIPPGLLALIYKCRWDVEKLYDVFKNKLGETKAWGKTDEAKSQQAHFIAMAHNLMMILEEDLRREEGIEDQVALRRRAKRSQADKETAEAAGRMANPMVVAWRRPTQVSFQFIRWLRCCLSQKPSWCAAVDLLRPLSLNYLS